MRLRRTYLLCATFVVLVFALAGPPVAGAPKGCSKTASSNAAVFDASCAFTYAGNGIRIEGMMVAAGWDYDGGCVVNPCRVPGARLRVYILDHSFFVPCAAVGQGLLVCQGREQPAVLPSVGETVACYAFAETGADKYRTSMVAFRCSSGKPNV